MSSPYSEDPGAATVVQSPASSSHTFEGELTNPYQQAKHDKTNAGYHSLGVVWEDVTVHGAGGGKKYVESLDISVLLSSSTSTPS